MWCKFGHATLKNLRQRNPRARVRQNGESTNKFIRQVLRGGQFFWVPRATYRTFRLNPRIQVLGARFEKSRFHFGLFPGAPQKSETTSATQLLILFQKRGL